MNTSGNNKQLSYSTDMTTDMEKKFVYSIVSLVLEFASHLDSENIDSTDSCFSEQVSELENSTFIDSDTDLSTICVRINAQLAHIGMRVGFKDMAGILIMYAAPVTSTYIEISIYGKVELNPFQEMTKFLVKEYVSCMKDGDIFTPEQLTKMRFSSPNPLYFSRNDLEILVIINHFLSVDADAMHINFTEDCTQCIYLKGSMKKLPLINHLLTKQMEDVYYTNLKGKDPSKGFISLQPDGYSALFILSYDEFLEFCVVFNTRPESNLKLGATLEEGEHLCIHIVDKTFLSLSISDNGTCDFSPTRYFDDLATTLSEEYTAKYSFDDLATKLSEEYTAKYGTDLTAILHIDKRLSEKLNLTVPKERIEEYTAYLLYNLSNRLILKSLALGIDFDRKQLVVAGINNPNVLILNRNGKMLPHSDVKRNMH